MNVDTLAISRDTAIESINDIEALPKLKRTEEDEHLLSIFKAVRKHDARVIHLANAFRKTGLKDDFTPKLGIAAAHWKDVVFMRDSGGRGGFRNLNEYSDTAWDFTCYRGARTPGAIRQEFALPDGTFPDIEQKRRTVLKSAVPRIPPKLRPQYALHNYQILFEAEEWATHVAVYPRDPFLLKHITGFLYVVIAEWELTELEASLLGSIRAGN